MSGGQVVILRAPEDSGELAEAIRAQNFEPLAEPVLAVGFLDADFSLIDAEDMLVFTSAHGVEAFARGCDLRSNAVYVVGKNTAEAAGLAGFERIETGAGTVADLAKDLVAEYKTTLKPLIYVRAADISYDLKGFLTENGVEMREIIAYRADPAQNLSIKLLHALDRGQIKAVCVFSARGGQVFADLIEQYGRTVRLKTVMALCLSEHVVQSVSVLPFLRCVVAPTPDRHGMIKLVEDISINKE